MSIFQESFYSSESAKEEENHFKLEWVSKVVPREATPAPYASAPKLQSTNSSAPAPSFEEFEAMVLKRLSDAAAAQKESSSVASSAF